MFAAKPQRPTRETMGTSRRAAILSRIDRLLGVFTVLAAYLVGMDDGRRSLLIQIPPSCLIV
jgi:hypothetical protein